MTLEPLSWASTAPVRNLNSERRGPTGQEGRKELAFKAQAGLLAGKPGESVEKPCWVPELQEGMETESLGLGQL